MLTRLSYLAVKRETTVATAVKPTHFIRYKEGDIGYQQEIIANNPIQNNRRNALNAVKGKVTTEGTLSFDYDYNESVHWIAAALGGLVSADISSETDASVFTHTMTMANTLPSLSVEQGKGNLTDTTNNRQNYEVARSFGVLVNSFKISGSDGIVSMEVNVKAHGQFLKANLIGDAAAGSSVALKLDTIEGLVTTVDTVNIYDETPQSEADAIASLSVANTTITIATLGNSYTVADRAKVELVPQSPSYATLAQVASWYHAKFQIGDDLTDAATADFKNIENWEFEYMNNLEERFGSKRQSPSVIAPKGAKATLKYTVYFENVADRDLYLNQTKKAGIMTIVNNNEIISATDTDQNKYSLKIEMSDIRATSYENPTGTDELYAATVEGECYYDVSDGRAVRIIATNAKAGTEYTA